MFFRYIDGQAYISVNNQAIPTNISELNCRAGHHKTVPVELVLDPGDVNTIKLGAFGSSGTLISQFSYLNRLYAIRSMIYNADVLSRFVDFEMHLDGIELYEEED